MATALHPQTLLTLTYDGQVLPPKYGFPMKLRMPTKLGYKNPKHIMVIAVTNTFPGGYWEDQGYNWFVAVEVDRAPRRFHETHRCIGPADCGTRYYGIAAAQEP